MMWTKAMPIDDAIDLMRAALTAPVPLAHDLNCEYSKWGTKCTCAAPVKDARHAARTGGDVRNREQTRFEPPS